MRARKNVEVMLHGGVWALEIALGPITLWKGLGTAGLLLQRRDMNYIETLFSPPLVPRLPPPCPISYCDFRAKIPHIVVCTYPTVPAFLFLFSLERIFSAFSLQGRECEKIIDLQRCQCWAMLLGANILFQWPNSHMNRRGWIRTKPGGENDWISWNQIRSRHRLASREPLPSGFKWLPAFKAPSGSTVEMDFPKVASVHVVYLIFFFSLILRKYCMKNKPR